MFDDAIVGAGILGLAHAYHLAKRGRRVIVFERAPRAMGASIRNFGMLWPIGQSAGSMRRLALRSLTIWTEVLEAAGLWHERAGSLHLAYREDEAQVLQEFTRDAADREIDCEFLNASQVLALSSAVRPDGLIAGMASPTETCVDPREVIERLPEWLGRQYGVRFVFGTAVTEYERPKIRAGGQEWHASHLYLCAGDDTETLFPEFLQNASLVRCKLQMMRSQPLDGWRLGPMLAAGLTLRHYAAFQDCPTLPALKRRVAEETPEYDRYGIHVMASQNGRGELVIGDSHEYGALIEPFDNPEIDALILRYLETFLQAPELRIAARWHGVYAKHPTEPYTVARASACRYADPGAHPRPRSGPRRWRCAPGTHGTPSGGEAAEGCRSSPACQPAPGVTVITGVGGAGMTLSFGLAEQVVRENLGEA